MATISVALCTYNGAKYLRQQLDSILNQSFQADEIVIVDDSSSDNTLMILKEYEQKTNKIKLFVNEQNIGYLNNFSLAISKTTCDYVALSDQDDVWAANHLEVLLSSIGNKAISVGGAELIDTNGNSLGITFGKLRHNLFIPDGDIPKAYKIIYDYNPYRGADMLINRKWVEHYLPIPDGVGYHDTYFSACAVLSSGLVVVKDIISYYRIHERQISKQLLKGVTLLDELKRRRHHICFYNKRLIIQAIKERSELIPPQASAFIDEFNDIQELDKQRFKRVIILKTLFSHYKDIYSCPTYKYIIPRALHFLLTP